MKSAQFSSNQKHWMIWIGRIALMIAGLVGYWLLPPIYPFDVDEPSYVKWADAAIAIGLGVFAWSTFHIFEPRRHGRRWMLIKVICIPIVWLLLVIVLAMLFIHSGQMEEYLHYIVSICR